MFFRSKQYLPWANQNRGLLAFVRTAAENSLTNAFFKTRERTIDKPKIILEWTLLVFLIYPC